MTTFNRTQPHGKISPPMPIEKWETVAHYEQNGILFDAHGLPCDPAIRAKKAEAPKAAEAPAAAAPAADGKPAKPAKGKKAAAEPAAAPAAPAPAPAPGLDLAAWARGQKDYLATELFKSIRAKYNVQLSQRRDAIDLLIKEGVVTAAEARKDIV